MKILKYILRVILKRRWYIILLPLFATILTFLFTANLGLNYKVSTTIFTGFASGYSIESGSSIKSTSDYISTSMDNLINIIKSKNTLEKVSMRLYAENMIFGDSTTDNSTIKQKNFIEIFNRTPLEVRKLIKKNSIEKTINSLDRYKKVSPKNFVYGLFNWNHRHYCYDALNRIEVNRLENSDMIIISYENDDPGITFNTIKILNDEFIKEYLVLRFGETDSVIKYFQSELARVGALLRNNEDSLTDYYVDNKIINYGEQTTQTAYLAREYNLEYLRLKMNYNSSKATLEEVEKRMDINLKSLKNNSKFIEFLGDISKIRHDIAFRELNGMDSTNNYKKEIERSNKEIRNKEKEIRELLSTYTNDRYTKEGISSTNIVNEWFTELMKNTQAEAELQVLAQRQKKLDDDYIFYAPIGSSLKRKERQISFLENTYLNLLQNLNSALLRRKNLQMTSSTIKVINPPFFPLNSLPSKRKMIVFGVLFGSFIFILSYFLIIELLDRSLKNKLKAELLIGNEVIGCFPDTPKGKHRRYENEILDISRNHLLSSIINNLKPNDQESIINIISNEKGEGKSFIAEHLHNIFNEKGISSKLVSNNKDFSHEDSKYLLANSIRDFCDFNNEKIIIIEHPALKESNIPINILKSASINLFIGMASKVWKDSDQLLFDRLEKQSNKENLFVYLNKTSIEATEVFTGLLPPYSWSRKLIYKIIQMDFKTQ